MKNKKILAGVVLLVIVLVGIFGWVYFNSRIPSKPSSFLIEDTIKNTQNVNSVRFDSAIVANLGNRTQNLTSFSELDRVNEREQVHLFFTVPGKNETRQDYYKIGNTMYSNLNGSWQTQRITLLDYNLNELTSELSKLNRVAFIKTEKINNVDAFLLREDMSQSDALLLLQGVFNVGNSTNYVFNNGATFWWIDARKNLVLLESRSISAELNGVPVNVTWQNSYFDYNVKLNITLPKINASI